ncbi:MAG TPA: glutamate--cysteine ligase [Acidimicrobiia bacterium]|nr:glutamate--cysteine ligase [Acidimicrobiia bacterium]
MSVVFNRSPDPTIGVELELQIVDRETLDHLPVASVILDTLGHPPTVKHELFECTIEITTGICRTVAEARDDLERELARVTEICDDRGWLVLAAGSHPFARWQDRVVSPNPRYRELIERVQLPLRKLLIFGTHVHIGVDHPEKAIAIQNAMRVFLPHFLSLSASSPYWMGEDSGMASSRSMIFDVMPTAGIPIELRNWGEFVRYISALRSSRAIESIREVWTDIRPHPDLGTVELRICDAMPTLSEVSAIAALTQSLNAWLARRYDEGAPLPRLSPWIIRENKWRAARYGLEADLVIDDDGGLEPLLAGVRDLLRDLRPIATDLGCAEELASIGAIVERGPSYRRQREVFDRRKGLDDVVRSLVDELRTDVLTPAIS